MLAFMACGQLAQSTAFPSQDVSPQLMKAVPIKTYAELELYLEVLPALEAQGRHDLTEIIKRKIWLFEAEHRLRLNHLRPLLKKLLGRK